MQSQQTPKRRRKNNNPITPAFMRPADAGPYLGIGRNKLDELTETDPDFPRKIRISSRCVGWRKIDLDNWLAMKAAQEAAL